MSFLLKPAHWLLVALALSATAAGQLVPTQLTTPVSGAANAAHDPLGRDTPSGTVYGFLQAAQAGNYSTAAQYLQMSNARRLTQGEDLASKLKLVMDRAFTGDLRAISNQRDGTPQEGVPLDRQRIGSLSAGDVDDELTLVHVPDAGGARIWLISSDTLAKIPELYEQVQVRQVETRLPGFFVHNEFAGLPVWQWFAILLAIPFAAGLGWVAVQLLKFPRYIWLRRHKQFLIPAWAAISSPLWLVLTAIIHALCMRYVRLPLLQRHYYQMLIGVVLIIGFNWLLWRILQRLARGVRERAIYAGRAGTGSVMLLGERILKALILILAVFLILSTLGFNMTTALAGLGIGGIAVAFAAQKTLENLFGGISLLGDEVIHVGDPAFDRGMMGAHFMLKALHHGVTRSTHHLVESARQFWLAYEGPAGVDQSIRHTGGVMVARLYGKSPVDYLVDEASRQRAHRIGAMALGGQVRTVDDLLELLDNELRS